MIFNVLPPGEIVDDEEADSSSAAADSADMASASAAVRKIFVSSATGLPSSKTCDRAAVSCRIQSTACAAGVDGSISLQVHAERKESSGTHIPRTIV